MKNMTLRRLKQLSRKEEEWGSATDRDVYSAGKNEIYQPASETFKTLDSYKNTSDVYNYKTLAYSGGTLPRNHRKGASLKWKSLTHSPAQQRKIIILEKEDNETFGFEIQTYGLHHQNENSLEMCTFVCKVHDHSPAHAGGLKVGDTIASVNDASVEGYKHKEMVELIRSAGNYIRLETVYGDSIRKAELETRLQYLKQTLHEKWGEYRSLMVQEQRLVHGIVLNDPAMYETLESVRACIYGTSSGTKPIPSPSPASDRQLYSTGREPLQHPVPSQSPASHRQRYSTGSPCSSTSCVRSSTVESEDALYQTCFFEEGIHNSAGDKGKQPGVPCKKGLSDLFSTTKSSLSRSASTRSYQTRSWDKTSNSSSSSSQSNYGSLPRKKKQKSFRSTFLKFIPGLNRSLEEEESKF
ncbi:general receptor for phosphoinositides 1-associated scaffold protein-like [Acipenser ruthenus]|uniref:general receptor for phosphoinositides 1-associated scaffold protein-like n=1 Tax=Acipenser ruthenus TaxID=7906 RepID=UPI00145AA98B|nr:general receptor for phosphoinositides 1-associated scaffold protein-like [Acipenser ruthenus]